MGGGALWCSVVWVKERDSHGPIPYTSPRVQYRGPESSLDARFVLMMPLGLMSRHDVALVSASGMATSAGYSL